MKDLNQKSNSIYVWTMGLQQLGQWEGRVFKAYLGLHVTKVRWGKGNKQVIKAGCKIVFKMHPCQAPLGASLVLSNITTALGKHIFTIKIRRLLSGSPAKDIVQLQQDFGWRMGIDKEWITYLWKLNR